MSFSMHQGFHWRETPHQGDLFQINPHRKVYTYFYDDLAIAKIEPHDRGLAVRFVADGVDDPGRPVAVPSVPRGKTFVQNWILPRQMQVIAACRFAQMMEDMPSFGPGVMPSHPENTASL